MPDPHQFKGALAGASSLYLLSQFLFPSQIGAHHIDLESNNTTINPAQLRKVYIPPAKAAPRTTQGSVGSRGCEQSVPVSLHLFAPYDHVGQTTQGHPSFFWYVSGTPDVPMEFSLVEPNVPKPIYIAQITASNGEVVKLSLPQNLPALETGKDYRWSVSLICNPLRRSNDVYARSWIERSQPSDNLSHRLAFTQTEYERAIAYGQEGFWYDALAAITNAQAVKPQDRNVLDLRRAFLEQVGLNQIIGDPLSKSVRVNVASQKQK
jgi:Domain of Unknown Function (DUF928)